MITNEIPGKPAVAATFSPGQTVGESFTLKQKLSTGDPGAPGGDLGIPWLAHDSESGKDVSLLFLPAALLGDARVMEELRAQVKLNRQLIHPHVLRTHDFIEEEGWAAISSDPVEADTLASLLEKQKNGAFDPSQAQAWLSSVCQTLDDAHRAGLLHRDLVPRNILLAKDGKVLVANFGISRI
ncbi:MAG TPA: protein kinase, partial [Chthoniobacteraceae bacterium]|nr:protein kinase [Chthoniobacteraceae bacterium]